MAGMKIPNRETQHRGDYGKTGFHEALYSLGTGEWDFKPVIYDAWGTDNRLGNSAAVYKYDIWANLHYGYVGAAAGFSKDELNWGANVQQQADSKSEDSTRDQEAIEAGVALYDRSPAAVDCTQLQNILNAHEPSDYNKETGWGYLDYGLRGNIQTEDGRTITK